MNTHEIEGNWKQLKGAAKQQWGKLTDDDVTEIEGSSEKLIGKLQERYGIERAEAEKRVNDWHPTQ